MKIGPFSMETCFVMAILCCLCCELSSKTRMSWLKLSESMRVSEMKAKRLVLFFISSFCFDMVVDGLNVTPVWIANINILRWMTSSTTKMPMK